MNTKETGPYDSETIQVAMNMKISTLAWLDDLKEEFGLRSRSDVLNRLLEELMPKDDEGNFM